MCIFSFAFKIETLFPTECFTLFCLFANLEVAERYKYIQKIWRKLDANLKQNYVNKSRQNRFKKKSDDKVANASVVVKANSLKSSMSSTGLNIKSPANSDRQSSDAENFNSRSTTPFVSLEESSENLAHQRQFNMAKTPADEKSHKPQNPKTPN